MIMSVQSQIARSLFVNSRLLSLVQCSGLFEDSKEFVDMPMLDEPETIITAFSTLSDTTPPALASFLHSHFGPAGSDLNQVHPEDHVDNPISLGGIHDTSLRQWAHEVHSLWPVLCRQVSPIVATAQQRHSLLAVPFPFVIPGGRFREMYYWDSYWTIKGLLASDMALTAKCIIGNLAYLIETYGFVPNGNRSYYMGRSQPPMFAYCVDCYYRQTGDIQFLKRMLPVVERELEWWRTNRCVQLGRSLLYQYRSITSHPRPESYKEDLSTAEFHKLDSFSEIASAAESGWDFSSRWVNDLSMTLAEELHDGQPSPLSDSYVISDVKTTRIIPADLNALIAGAHRRLTELYADVGEEELRTKHNNAFQLMSEAIERHFWHPLDGMWYDLNLDGSHRRRFYASNLVPLFAGAGIESAHVDAVVAYLQNNGLLEYSGGVPCSIYHSREQWDAPNAFAPMMDMLIEGLNDVQHATDQSTELAMQLCKKWLRTNYITHKRHRYMLEKYDVTNDWAPVGGGEYPVQTGFAWSNGVALHLLNKYAKTENVFGTAEFG